MVTYRTVPSTEMLEHAFQPQRLASERRTFTQVGRAGWIYIWMFTISSYTDFNAEWTDSRVA